MKTQIEKEMILKSIYWDYDINPATLLSVLNGEKEEIKDFLTKERILLRMAERLSWLEITGILEKSQLKDLVTNKLIEKLRQPELKEKYEFIRKVLSGETLPLTGWGVEYYQKIKHTLLSDRWYRTEQALL